MAGFADKVTFLIWVVVEFATRLTSLLSANNCRMPISESRNTGMAVQRKHETLTFDDAAEVEETLPSELEALFYVM
jgi:hypothetical protein